MTAYTLFKQAYTQYMGQLIWDINDMADKCTVRKYIKQALEGILGQYSFVGGGSNGFRLEFGVKIDVDADIDTTNPVEYDVDEIIANKLLTNTKCLKAIRLYDGHWLCCYDETTGTWTFLHYIFRWEAEKSAEKWCGYSDKHKYWCWIVKVGYIGVDA